MSLLYADLTGVPIVRATLTVPFSGIWHADVLLDRALPAPVVGPQLLSLAGTTWACSPVRAIDFSGERMVRLVGGTGGWRRTIPFRAYASAAGVPTAVVLLDAAAAALELPPVLDPTVPPLLGTAFCRSAGPASLVLQQVLGDGWYMDPAGIVQTAPRPPLPVPSLFDTIAVDGRAGRYVIATEHPGDWVPGRLFASTYAQGTVSRVAHRLDKGELRTEVMVS